MPFKETCPVEERIALFRDYETGVFTVSELCCRYGISRETFYVWKRRRESGDRAARLVVVPAGESPASRGVQPLL